MSSLYNTPWDYENLPEGKKFPAVASFLFVSYSKLMRLHKGTRVSFRNWDVAIHVVFNYRSTFILSMIRDYKTNLN